MSVTARASSSGDNAVIAAVKKCGGNACLGRRHDWIALGFIEWVMEKARSSILVLRDILLYADLLVGDVDGFGVIF